MSKVSIKLDTLKGIGNAVRAKKGTAEQIPVANLASEIESIQTGTDTSKDTVTAETMLEGVTAHNASGEPITGTIPTYDGAMQDGLESYPKFQEKTATENGEVLPDEGFDGLSKVTVNVPSTGGGSANKTIVVTPFNYTKYPIYYDMFLKVSDEEFTDEELLNSYIFECSIDGNTVKSSLSGAPHSFYEKIAGGNYEDYFGVWVSGIIEETPGLKQVNGFIFYAEYDITDGDMTLTKGLYTISPRLFINSNILIINP